MIAYIFIALHLIKLIIIAASLLQSKPLIYNNCMRMLSDGPTRRVVQLRCQAAADLREPLITRVANSMHLCTGTGALVPRTEEVSITGLIGH